MDRNSFDNSCLPLQKITNEFSRNIHSLYVRSAQNFFSFFTCMSIVWEPHMTNQYYQPGSIGYEAMMYQQ